jgi:hypothetical protein
MADLLTALESKLLVLLQPLVDESALAAQEDNLVYQIMVTPFDSRTDIDELVERYRTAMPGAFLSLPKVDYLTSPNGFRLCNADCHYGLLVGLGQRMDRATANAYARAMQQRCAQYLMNVALDGSGISAKLDYVRPTSWEVGWEADSNLTSFLMGFSVSVRNWQVNSPS